MTNAATWLATWAVAFACSASASAAAIDPQFVRLREIDLPLEFESDSRALLRQVELYVRKRGGDWTMAQRVNPQATTFHYETPGDGDYEFALRWILKDGRSDPATVKDLVPQKRVVVDTVPPEVRLESVQDADGRSAVRWTVIGEDADFSSFSLEYRVEPSPTWQPIVARPGREGTATVPATRGLSEVRLHLRDKAGNLGQKSLVVASFASAGVGPGDRPATPRPRTGNDFPLTPLDDGPNLPTPPTGPALEAADPVATRPAPPAALPVMSEARNGDAWAPPPAAADRRPMLGDVPTKFVNSPRFQINYRVDERPRSGIKNILLYFKTPEHPQWVRVAATPKPPPDGPFDLKVSREGYYGIIIRGSNGVNVADQDPAATEKPQLVVVVDTTPPAITLGTPRVGQGTQAGTVVFSWDVRDQHPADGKVTLSYRNREGEDKGDWIVLQKGLKYRGEHPWTMTPQSPYRFDYRIEAEDAAGNTAEAICPEPVSTDFTVPRVVAIDARPLPAKAGGPTEPDAPVVEQRTKDVGIPVPPPPAGESPKVKPNYPPLTPAGAKKGKG